MDRRSFLKSATAGAAGPLLLSGQKKASPNEKFVVAAMGLRARGRAVLGLFASIPEVEIAALCDVDANQFPAALEIIAKHQRKAPRTETDFRRVIEDKTIDIPLVTTPDHWHAIPAILACQNGKHVYVEKPISHNLAEGQAMVRAARRYRRVVQVGVQSRSSRHVAEACEHIRTGGIGRVFFARGWESSRQNSVGRPADENPPPGVDYDLWLGPAPLRPFNRNRFHGTWRWFFDYGTGDLGNDGVHRIDYARRGLEAGFAFAGGARSSPEMSDRILAGVRGSERSKTPRPSATAFARHTGVDMQLPSPTPLAPSGVKGEGLSMCRISTSGNSVEVGRR